MEATYHLTASEARESFADVLNRVSYGHDCVVVESRGKERAAVISIEDLHLLERLRQEEEDRIDAAEAARVLADPNEERVSWESLKDDLGL